MQKVKFTLLFCATLFLYKSHAQNTVRIIDYYDSKTKLAYYLAWDIKSGKSVQYYWSIPDHNWKAMQVNLPGDPVTGATGNIMFDAYYDQNTEKAYYLAWDTKTGKSTQYYWNISKHNWQAVEINLPENPLPGATGDIMMDSYYDQTTHKAYYLVYDASTGRSIQYYWDNQVHKWHPMEVNLPGNPLK